MWHILEPLFAMLFYKKGTGGKLKPIEANMKLFDMKV